MGFRSIFDFELIKKLLTSPKFSFWYAFVISCRSGTFFSLILNLLNLNIICWPLFCSYDSLHGVAGVYAHKIFVEELGADRSSLLNCVPKVNLKFSSRVSENAN
jgi:phosphoglucomutase